MTCNCVQASLSAFLDEELTGREMLEVREHLSVCNECQAEFEAVQVVKNLLGTSPIPEPSADFEDRLVHAVLSATATEAKPRRMGLLGLTAVAAASMLFTLLVINQVGRSDNPSSISMQKTDEIAYEMVQRDRALSAAADPLSGAPVMPVTYQGGR